jgi:hypothetical protein
MDFNATIDLIIKDLSEVREIIDDLKNYPGVPVLQIELAKSKCKSTGEVIALLKNLQNETVIIKEEPDKHTPAQKQPEKQLLELHEESVTDNTSEPGKKETDSTVRKNVQPGVEQEDKSKKNLAKAAETKIIADRFSQASTSFNDELGNRNSDEEIPDILKTIPITSLSEAIGVNDRFLFIREIFKGNKEAYAEAISRLENTNSMTEARAIIVSYTGDNTENEAILQLLDLMKRKLPANE